MGKEAVMLGAIRIRSLGDLPAFLHSYDLSTQSRRLESHTNTASNTPPCSAWVIWSGQCIQPPRFFCAPHTCGGSPCFFFAAMDLCGSAHALWIGAVCHAEKRPDHPLGVSDAGQRPGARMYETTGIEVPPLSVRRPVGQELCRCVVAFGVRVAGEPAGNFHVRQGIIGHVLVPSLQLSSLLERLQQDIDSAVEAVFHLVEPVRESHGCAPCRMGWCWARARWWCSVLYWIRRTGGGLSWRARPAPSRDTGDHTLVPAGLRGTAEAAGPRPASGDRQRPWCHG